MPDVNETTINPATFGDRGRAFLQSADRSKNHADRTVQDGADKVSQQMDRHEQSIFSKQEADAIEDLNRLRSFSQGVLRR